METTKLIPAELAWVFIDRLFEGDDENWLYVKKGWAAYKRTGELKFFENQYLSRVYWKEARFCFCMDSCKNIIGYAQAKDSIFLDGRNEPVTIQKEHIQAIKTNGWKLFVHSERVYGRCVIQLHQN